MKRILGLDLGTTSIGWALVEESQNKLDSKIIKLGVRVNPLSTDEKTDFEKGRPLSINAERTLKRGARRNLQRYKLRRENLIDILIKNGFVTKDTPLTEIGKETTHHTLTLRAKAAKERISLEDFAKVLLNINKKRGYKSSRKSNNEDGGQAIDGMSIAKQLYEEEITPGQYVLNILNNKKKYIPDFYRSDLKAEFDKIWKIQSDFYKEVLTDKLYIELQEKSKTATWAILEKPLQLVGIKRSGSASDKRLENYQWRVNGLTEKLEPEHLAIVLQEINNKINQSSGYLGAISDRSKKLFLEKKTVGEYLYEQLLKNPHTSLKNQVFYRQDYLDEFETIWNTQAQHHKELKPQLKVTIRDVIIFYQRKLKSQKSQLSFCLFESWQQEYTEKETKKNKTRTIGRRVIPKSSLLFQEFKIWQNLNNLEFTNIEEKTKIEVKDLDDGLRKGIFDELNVRGDLKPNDILKIIGKEIKLGKISLWKSNLEKIEGNRTNQALFNIYQTIAELEGYGIDWKKQTAKEIIDELKAIFPVIGIDKDILEFNSELEPIDKQASYQFWHLLYSAEDDDKITAEDKVVYGNSNVSLKKKLHHKYGFAPRYATMIANISFSQEYGNLSSKAISKIVPYLKDGHTYSEACAHAGYNHSKSYTADELKNRVLKPKLDLLKKNSLRNPVVEKILNQMVNVVNQIIDTYGKPDEIRIELARELKKSAKERAEMTKGIASATKRNDDIRSLIRKEFNIPNPTKNDIIRYRLYQELESRGHKDLFTNKYIERSQLFSKNIDIEHIIPKALLFDDSYSNKTLAFRKVNIKKANRTAIDFISQDYHSDLEKFTERVESLYQDGKISRGKRNKLLMPQAKIPDGFIERDLRNSQYIAKKAKEMLFEVFPEVFATSGSITDKLRSDWDLVNVMKELNLPKYRALNLTEFEERLDKNTQHLKKYEVITGWSKRNDHRHHAMDALTVAFTTRNHIQYINNLNARRDTSRDNHPLIKNIENLITEVDPRGKRIFKAPAPRFRESAKTHIESILVSFKNKNKVVTKNINITKLADGKSLKKIQLTPRGQLHKETIYGKSKRPEGKPTKINKRFTYDKAKTIVNGLQRKIVLEHLAKYENKNQVAFDTKTIKESPLLYLNEPLKEVVCFENIYTIRKDINADNFKNEKLINKVVDKGVREALKKRLKIYDGDAKKAFTDLEKKPIWLNKAKGIAIKRATITGVSNAEALHTAKNHLGKTILEEMPVDYVSTGNNHHIAIYRDNNDKLQEEVVSFYEAVARVNQGEEIIRKNHPQGWEFLFTMKQNEMFVFPSNDFDPTKIDLLDTTKASLISPHLFRVQKIASKNYMFRHHLETELNDDKKTRGVTWENIRSTTPLRDIIKVRLNHIGEIVQVSEY